MENLERFFCIYLYFLIIVKYPVEATMDFSFSLFFLKFTDVLLVLPTIC